MEVSFVVYKKHTGWNFWMYLDGTFGCTWMYYLGITG